tara:strand:+ start:110 stop:373 length:264 start_codon:yes stop_codon:yes gene_type:complete
MKKMGSIRIYTNFIITRRASQNDTCFHFELFFNNKEFMAPSRNATWVISEKSVTEYFQNPVQQNNNSMHDVAFACEVPSRTNIDLKK